MEGCSMWRPKTPGRVSEARERKLTGRAGSSEGGGRWLAQDEKARGKREKNEKAVRISQLGCAQTPPNRDAEHGDEGAAEGAEVVGVALAQKRHAHHCVCVRMCGRHLARSSRPLRTRPLPALPHRAC